MSELPKPERNMEAWATNTEMSRALFSAGVSRELSRPETSDLAELSPILDTGISAKVGQNHFSQNYVVISIINVKERMSVY